MNYRQAVEDALKEGALDYKITRDGTETTFVFPLNLKNVKGIDATLILFEGGDIEIYMHLVRVVPANKADAMLKLLNQLNSLFRYICLSMNQENTVWASYDFTLFGEEEDIGTQVLGMIYIMAELVDTCAPKIIACKNS